MSKEHYFIIEPFDRVFFKGNYSFNKSDHSSDYVKSIFPPSPFSITGTIRTVIAKHYGWDGQSKWSYNLIKKLGNGTDLGPLEFYGPYILLKENDRLFPLFPVPLHIVGQISTQEQDDDKIMDLDFLIPSKKKYLSNISKNKDDRKSVLIPRDKKIEKRKRLLNYYVRFEDLKKILSFRWEDLNNIHFISANELWQTENEIGIEINPDTNTAIEGNLFSRQMFRLKNVILCMKVKGIDLPDSLENYYSRIGGEGKIAAVSYKKIDFPHIDKLPSDEIISNNFIITFITPAYLGASLDEVIGFLSRTFGSDVVGASIGNITRIGGWDSTKKEPLEVKPFIPSGSTFFFQKKDKHTSLVKKLITNKIGELTDFGFGQFLIGKWKKGD